MQLIKPFLHSPFAVISAPICPSPSGYKSGCVGFCRLTKKPFGWMYIETPMLMSDRFTQGIQACHDLRGVTKKNVTCKREFNTPGGSTKDFHAQFIL